MNVFENDTELISQADILRETMDMPKLRVEYEEWYSQVHRITSLVIPERVDDLEDAYKGISNYLITHLSYPGQGSRQIFQAQLEQQKGILRAAFSAGYIHKNNKSSEEIVESIFDRFHVVAKQFEERHDNRPTIAIEDEYDVQDLLHGLLKLYFDDIRPEEWTPSYAGCSSRVDFLLKNEKMVIEVKKTRPNLLDREIGEQLIIDIHKYRSHPSCKTLLCFVYDPDQLISNPDGLENDLNKEHDNLRVLVKVVPKRA
jgi:hypothetical protein